MLVACSHVELTSIVSLAMAKTGALTLKESKEKTGSRRISFAQKNCESFFSGLMKLPQFEQKLSKVSLLVLHCEHGGTLLVFETIFIFKNFSDIKSIRIIPTKMRSNPATVWKMFMAISSPKKTAAEIIVVMRIMFRTSNIRKPSGNITIFFQEEVEIMMARKAANIVKAIKV